MTEHAVVIAGGGPTGLMLAGELALAGIDVVIVERRTSQDLDGSRAGGLHSRTIEVLDQRGIAERFLSEGQEHPFVGYAGTLLDISDFPTRHNYVLALWQSHFERILAGWVGELGVPILRGREVVGFAQDDTGVDVELSGDTSLRAEYLVGCDGGRSLIRKAAGIDFPGLDPSTSWLIAEVEMDEEPEIGMRPEGGGIGPVNREEGGGPYRVVLLEKHGRTHQRAHPAGSPRGARRRLRDGLRGAQPHLDLPVHRHDPAGGVLPRGTRAARRRRRTRASPARRPGPQHRRAGCREPGMEAGPGGQQDITREPPGHLPRRTASGRCPGVAQHHGAGRAQPHRRAQQGPPRHHARTAEHGRAAPAHRRDALRSRHPLRPRRADTRCSGGACPTSTCTPRTVPRASSPCCTTPGPCSSTSANPAVSTSLLGRIESGWSTPSTMACGSSRSLARSLRPPAVLIRPDGHVAWAGDLTDPELPRALATWFGAATPAG